MFNRLVHEEITKLRQELDNRLKIILNLQQSVSSSSMAAHVHQAMNTEPTIYSEG